LPNLKNYTWVREFRKNSGGCSICFYELSNSICFKTAFVTPEREFFDLPRALARGKETFQ